MTSLLKIKKYYDTICNNSGLSLGNYIRVLKNVCQMYILTYNSSYGQPPVTDWFSTDSQQLGGRSSEVYFPTCYY